MAPQVVIKLNDSLSGDNQQICVDFITSIYLNQVVIRVVLPYSAGAEMSSSLVWGCRVNLFNNRGQGTQFGRRGEVQFSR